MSSSDNEFLTKKREKEELCMLCKQNVFKYTCPRCFYKTCSVACVKAHKAKFNCNGQRDKFKKVSSQQDYNEKCFYRDINYMNNTVNEINTSNRKVFSLIEDVDKSKNKTFKNFKRICKKFRNITYFKSPLIMKCNKENKSYAESSTKKIYWTIKFVFICYNSISHLFSKCEFDDEVSSLSSIGEYLYEHKDEIDNAELLQYISSKNWLEQYKICMKINKENAKDFKNVFIYDKYSYETCEIGLPLKDILNGKEVYEYPTFYLFNNE